jgi:hypothetical protein
VGIEKLKEDEAVLFQRTSEAGSFPVLAIERAFLDGCNCECWVGMRMDTKEPATIAQSCSHEHHGIVLRFQEMLQESVVNPTKYEVKDEEPLVEACERLLNMAAEEVGV